MPGDAYTGISVRYRHPDTGHEQTVFSGSMAGKWQGDHDPAHETFASLGTAGDGYIPHTASFTMPHEEGRLPGTKHQTLLPRDMDSIRIRQYYKDKEKPR
jgi:hypothetical protein